MRKNNSFWYKKYINFYYSKIILFLWFLIPLSYFSPVIFALMSMEPMLGLDLLFKTSLIFFLVLIINTVFGLFLFKEFNSVLKFNWSLNLGLCLFSIIGFVFSIDIILYFCALFFMSFIWYIFSYISVKCTIKLSTNRY